MPFQVGGVAAHDDVQHVTTAKRDTAGGLAGLDASGNVLAPGPSVELTRDGNGDVFIKERTSGETIISLRRTGANAYTPYNNTVAGGKILQDSSMRHIPSGIVGFDSNSDIPHLRMKAASANLRHSHNATAFTPNAAYTKLKTYTFAYGITGALRIAFDLQTSNAALTAYGRVYKNGVAVGTEQTHTGDLLFTTVTEDITVTLNAGDTLELWAHLDGSADIASVRNFRLSYDNAADTVLVAGVSTS